MHLWVNRLTMLYTAISWKVVGKSAHDYPERYCGWFLVHCFSKKFEIMAREAMDLCLQMLKESNKSWFDSYSVRNSVLIISHNTFRDCHVHSYSDNLSRNNCKHKLKHVLSKKLIKYDFLHGKKILDAQGDAYLSDASKYASPSCHIAHRWLTLKRKWSMTSSEIIFSETTGQAYFLDVTGHTSPSRSEHTRWQVATTSHGDRSLRVYRWDD